MVNKNPNQLIAVTAGLTTLFLGGNAVAGALEAQAAARPSQHAIDKTARHMVGHLLRQMQHGPGGPFFESGHRKSSTSHYQTLSYSGKYYESNGQVADDLTIEFYGNPGRDEQFQLSEVDAASTLIVDHRHNTRTKLVFNRSNHGRDWVISDERTTAQRASTVRSRREPTWTMQRAKQDYQTDEEFITAIDQQAASEE